MALGRGPRSASWAPGRSGSLPAHVSPRRSSSRSFSRDGSPVTAADEWDAVEASSESAVAALTETAMDRAVGDTEEGRERHARTSTRAYRDAPRGDRGSPRSRSAPADLTRGGGFGRRIESPRRRKELTLESVGGGVRAGDRRALARAISLVEDGDPLAYPLVREVYPETGRAAVVGVTGPPGVGKSSLVGALVAHIRADDRTVGVVSVDPSSPSSRGALLGDRIRLSE